MADLDLSDTALADWLRRIADELANTGGTPFPKDHAEALRTAADRITPPAEEQL